MLHPKREVLESWYLFRSPLAVVLNPDTDIIWAQVQVHIQKTKITAVISDIQFKGDEARIIIYIRVLLV